MASSADGIQGVLTAERKQNWKLLRATGNMLWRVALLAGGVWIWVLLAIPAHVLLRIAGADLEQFIAFYPRFPEWLFATMSSKPLQALEAVAVWFFMGAAGHFLIVRKWKSIHSPWGKWGRPDSDLHGSARWASWDEIKAMSILPPSVTGGPPLSTRLKSKHTGLPVPTEEHEGVFIGAYEDPRTGKLMYLRHNGPEHVMAFAPTRSGKGVSLVLPTLLSWKHSVLVHDPKGEAWHLTAGFRREKLGQKVFYFDPTCAESWRVAGFNPMAEVRVGTSHEVGDAQNLATIVVDPDGKGLVDHWQKTSRSLITALILHLCYQMKREEGRQAHFGDVVRYFSQDSKSLQDTLQKMRDYQHLQDGPHPIVKETAQEMMNKDIRELTSVVSSAASYLSLYTDPVIAANTSRSDWRIADLMDGDTPASAYLVVRPSDADRLRPLLRVILTQITRTLTREMDFQEGRAISAYKHRLLLMLDEFTSMKKLAVMEAALAVMAGYGIKSYVIVQDVQQLEAVYGQAEQISSNCGVRICFAPNKAETAEKISKMCGRTTLVHKAQQVKAHEKPSAQLWQESSRELITAEEVMRLRAAETNHKGDIMRPGELLIFMAGQRPVRGLQSLFFRDATLAPRSRIPPPELRYGDLFSWRPGDEFDPANAVINGGALPVSDDLAGSLTFFEDDDDESPRIFDAQALLGQAPPDGGASAPSECATGEYDTSDQEPVAWPQATGISTKPGIGFGPNGLEFANEHLVRPKNYFWGVDTTRISGVADEPESALGDRVLESVPE